jgi:outer membrane protein TolC
MKNTFVVAALLVAGVTAASGATTERKSLPECIAIALERHPDLGAAGAAIDAGHQRILQAGSAALPQVAASYGANRRNASATSRTGAPIDGTRGGVGGSRTFNFHSASIGLTQLLFDFGQTLNAIRAARATERSLDQDRETVRQIVVFDVERSYFDVLKSVRLLAVADENVRQSRQHLDLADSRLQVGLAPRFDVTQARVQLANAELAQVTARNDVAIARENLRTAMGLDVPLEFDLVDVLDAQPAPVSETSAVALAGANRPELRSRREQEESLAQQVAALQKSYLPNVTGDASYNWTATEYPLQSNWSFGASVNLSVFNGGLTTAEIGEARANLARLRYQIRSLEQQIGREVRQSVLDVARAAEAIRVSERALGQARENLELAEGRYHTGVGNIIELTDAQASLVGAEANHVQALADHRTARATLDRATARPIVSAEANR